MAALPTVVDSTRTNRTPLLRLYKTCWSCVVSAALTVAMAQTMMMILDFLPSANEVCQSTEGKSSRKLVKQNKTEKAIRAGT